MHLYGVVDLTEDRKTDIFDLNRKEANANQGKVDRRGRMDEQGRIQDCPRGRREGYEI